jgi:hypothetical protein
LLIASWVSFGPEDVAHEVKVRREKEKNAAIIKRLKVVGDPEILFIRFI